MREEEGQREAIKAQDKRIKELMGQGYNYRHASQVAQREYPTPAQKRAANKRKPAEDM